MDNTDQNPITFKGPYITGDLDLNTSELLSVPSKPEYNSVVLAFKCTGMNAGVIDIDIKDLDYQDKVILGREVEARWNDYPKAKSTNEVMRSLLKEIISSEDDDVSLSHELYTRIQNAVNIEK